MSYDCVICDCDRYHTSFMHDIILYSLFISKIKKSENKNSNKVKDKIENKNRKKIN